MLNEKFKLDSDNSALSYSALNTKYISVCDSAEKLRTQLNTRDDELGLRGDLAARLSESQIKVERLESDLVLAREACSEYETKSKYLELANMRSKIKLLEDEIQYNKLDSDSKVYFI